MANYIKSLRINQVELLTRSVESDQRETRGVPYTVSNGIKRLELSAQIVGMDYFEDILSPCVMMTIDILSSAPIFNGFPIRGGEKVILDVDTASGKFLLETENDREDYAMYVYKVSGYTSDGASEQFRLHLVSKEGMSNEVTRCQKKYGKVPINQHVTDILENVLGTEKFNESNIERTSNYYSFIGNQKKPFHILTWLCPKGIPATGSSGTRGSEARGVAGYLFYETRDGFNFKSIDKLVSETSSDSTRNIIGSYSYDSVRQEDSSDFSIINYNFEKNVDVLKSLRVGMYANKTYFYDLYTNTVNLYTYYLKDEIRDKLGNEDQINVPFGFEESPSRVLLRTSDKGTLDPNDSADDSGRDSADMAKSFARYNLLFTQSLNMTVPCNLNLRAGGIIEVLFPTVSGINPRVDEQQSGKYLIKELRHHFEGNQMVTALKLIRDSYGLY